MPSIKQVTDALEDQVRILRDAKRWDEATKVKDQPAIAGPQPIPREQRPTYEELKAKYGPNWGINPDPEPKQLATAEEQERARKYSEYAAQNAKLPAPTVSDPEVWKLKGSDRVLDPKQQNRRPPTMAEARASLIKEFGQEKFDAVPDQPEAFQRMHYDLPKAAEGPVDEPKADLPPWPALDPPAESDPPDLPPWPTLDP